MIFHIAKRELYALFLSPLAWTLLAVVQFILAWTFFTQIDYFFQIQPQLVTMNNAPGVTDLVVAPLYSMASIILLMIMPLLCMRLISEERRSGTLTLLLSAPISMTEITLGKFLGIFIFILILVSMIGLMPLSLMMGTDLDIGKTLSGLLGMLLMISAFAAAGLYLSSLTRNPTIAAVSTFGLLLGLFIIDRGGSDASQTGSVFQYISLLNHFSPFVRGIIDTRDITYFVLFIVGFLTLTVKQLDAQRLQG